MLSILHLYVCSHVQVMAGFLLRMNCCKPGRTSFDLRSPLCWNGALRRPNTHQYWQAIINQSIIY